MPVESIVNAQFDAYNAHEGEAFIACVSEEFKGVRMPTETPLTTGKASLREFYVNPRFNNPKLSAVLISRIVLGDNVLDHNLIHERSPEPLESVAVFEIKKRSYYNSMVLFSVT